MKYISILACSNDLGSCCSDAGLVSILDIVRKVLDLFQVIVPILLLLMLTVQLIKLVINPDEKQGLKKITNRIVAAMIIFLLPMVVNILIINLPSNEGFQLSACWKTAGDMAEIQRTSTETYINKNAPKKTMLIGGSDDSKTVKAGQGSHVGQAVVNYALRFVGQPYKYNGQWNGDLPYVATDCSGFVKGVYAHYGITLDRSTDAMWANTANYTLVSENDIKAGDLAMYNGHVAMFTGNGKQIIHAANPQKGITIVDDYKNGASNFKGIMRINGAY